MNPLVKHLAQQARQEFLKLPTGYEPQQVGMYPQLMQLFAELVVEECLNTFANSNYTLQQIKQKFATNE